MANERFTVVVGIDYSESGDEALEQAIALAAERNAELHVLHVDDHIRATESGEQGEEAALAQVEKRAVDRLRVMGRRRGGPLPFKRVYSHYRMGSPAEQLVQLAADLDADLIVVGSHGRRGVKAFFLGSVAERVVRSAHCQVLVVRPKDHEGLGKVPEIEPPCPACLAKRAETNGEVFWCERHSERHVRAHHYHYAVDDPIDTASEPYASTPMRGV